MHICEAKFGNMFLIDGDGCRWAAGMGTPPKLAEYFTAAVAVSTDAGQSPRSGHAEQSR